MGRGWADDSLAAEYVPETVWKLQSSAGSARCQRAGSKCTPTSKSLLYVRAKFPHLGSSDAHQVTRVQLDVHMNGLLNAWRAVDGNDPITKFEEFKTRLLASLPDKPVILQPKWWLCGSISLMP